MTDGTSGTPEGSVLGGREEGLWAEIVRCELDSWRPRRLPAHFSPAPQRRRPPALGSLPLVMAACVILLTVATFADVTTNVTVVLENLAVIRTLPVPGAGGGAPAPIRQAPKPATGTGSAASTARTSNATGSPSPHIARVGTASESRTAAPSPSAQAPAPLPSPPVPQVTRQSPAAMPPPGSPSFPVDPPNGLSAGQPPGRSGSWAASPG